MKGWWTLFSVWGVVLGRVVEAAEFAFLDVVPRANNNERVIEPSFVCDEASKNCLLVAEYLDNGRRVASRRSTDGGRTWGGTTTLGTDDPTKPEFGCVGSFCVVTYRVAGAARLEARVTTDFGLTFQSPVTVHTDIVKVGRPGVGCFLENNVPTCVIGFESLDSGNYNIYEISQGSNPVFRQEIVVSGGRMYIKCRDEEFCIAAFGGGGPIRVMKRIAGNTQFQNLVELQDSVRHAVVSGTVITEKPEIAILNSNDIIISSSNRKGTGLGQIEVARSVDGGVTYSRFLTVAADNSKDFTEPALSCSSSICALVWQEETIGAVPQFVTSTDKFVSHTPVSSITGLTSRTNGPELQYEDPEVHCFNNGECISVFEGENFLSGIPIDSESIVIAVLEQTTPPPAGDDDDEDDQNNDNDDDSSNLGLIIAVAGASCGALVAAVIFFKKKNNNNNEKRDWHDRSSKKTVMSHDTMYTQRSGDTIYSGPNKGSTPLPMYNHQQIVPGGPPPGFSQFDVYGDGNNMAPLPNMFGQPGSPQEEHMSIPATFRGVSARPPIDEEGIHF